MQCINKLYLYHPDPDLIQGIYSLSGKTSYRKISYNLEAMGLDVIMIISLWNLTGISTAVLWRCLSNFRAVLEKSTPESHGFEILR